MLLESVNIEPYKSIVATIKNVPNIKIEDIKSSLLEHEAKLKDKETCNSSGPLAFMDESTIGVVVDKEASNKEDMETSLAIITRNLDNFLDISTTRQMKQTMLKKRLQPRVTWLAAM